eukprot:169069_1
MLSFNYHQQKKRKLDNETFMDELEKNELLKDIPFSTQELEEDEYDEELFMEKLSKHLEMKYDDDVKDATNTELSALDILTMDEKELDKLMPIHNDDIEQPIDIDSGFRYLPTFGSNSNSDTKPKRKRKKRNANRYYKVPQPNKKRKKNRNGPKKITQNARFILAQSKTA